MSTLQANKYSQAVKEIVALDPELEGKVKKEIDVKDNGHVHVISVKVQTREGEVKNDVTVNTHKLSAAQFKKFEENHQFLGYNKLIVLHMPSLQEQIDSIGNTSKKPSDIMASATQATPGKTELTLEEMLEAIKSNPEISKEIELVADQKAEAKAQARFDEMVANSKKGEGEGSTTTPGKTEGQEGSSMGKGDKGISEQDKKDQGFDEDAFNFAIDGKIEDKKAYADKNGIDLSGLRKAEDINTALITWKSELPKN